MKTLAAAAAAILAVAPLPAQTPADSAAIRQVALDYIEGYYDADAARMARALHPELVKRIVVRDRRFAREPLGDQGAAMLTEGTRAGGGRNIPPERRRKEVTILDVAWERAASVKILASDWVDYLHVAKVDGQWKIINVLWERTPPEDSAAAGRPAGSRGADAARTMDSVYARFSLGYQTLRPELVSALYGEDAFYLTPGLPIRRGRSVIHADFARFFGTVRERGDSISIAFDIQDRSVSGDLAYDIGYYVLTNVPKGAPARRDTGKFVVVWKRGADGTWKIHADGYSGVQAPAPPGG